MANEEALKYNTATYKCPTCGNFYRYDPRSNSLSCTYCDSSKPIEPTEKTFERPFNNDVINECVDWVGGVQIKCGECGATFESYDNNMSEHCPFCNANHVINIEQIPGIRPSGIIPFVIAREQCQEILTKYLVKKWFPKKKVMLIHRNCNTRGIYLPVFTFDSDTYMSYSMRYGTRHTRTVKDSQGNTHTETYYVYHNVSGNEFKHFNDIKVEASRYLKKNSYLTIDEFDTDNASQFHPQFLSGYEAERYSEPIDEAWDYANQEMVDILKNIIIHQYSGVDTIEYFNYDMSHENVTYKYILCPAYILEFKYKKKDYVCIINGETGTIRGKVPGFVGKVVGVVFGVLAVLALIGVALYFLLPLFGVEF